MDASTPAPVLRGDHASANPPVRGDRLLSWLERPLLLLDRGVSRLVPAARNPFAHTGAIATTTFIIATISGILTLLWYSPSVHQAYESVEAMTAATLTGGLVRSLHRYSSDACMLFALVHAVKLFAAKRFTGPRWLAWFTGILVIGVVWFVGWLGYWLIWDERARQVALGTAAMLDQLAIFAEPLSRSFLTDASINSLLFFMVFFLHMLVPLVVGFLLWLHIVRLSRPRFLADRAMTVWIMGALVVVSFVWPATSAGPARMGEHPAAFTMDWWYLAPLVLTERLGGGMLWLVALLAGVVIGSVPWSLRRRSAKVVAAEISNQNEGLNASPLVAPAPILRREAAVKVDSCNACRLCYEDCPYNAIQMVPRPADSKRAEPMVARVDASRCVGCGICTGSCNSAGIELSWLHSLVQRRRQDLRLEEGPTAVAFLCAESAGAGVELDAAGFSPQLPGYRVESVPCAGWVHALTIERAFRHGAPAVLLVGCGEGNCTWREGADHTDARLRGDRRPIVRPDKVDRDRVRLVRLDRGDVAALQREAQALLRGEASPPPRSRVRTAVGGVVVAAVVSAAMVVPSDLPLTLPAAEPALVVSFNHPGERGEHCRTRTPEELAKLPVHMRQAQVCERGRASVRLRVTVDGTVRLEKSYEPGGLSGDGNSVAIEALPLGTGPHQVKVEIGDTLDPARYNHVDEQSVVLAPRVRRVVLFDKRTGFGWH